MLQAWLWTLRISSLISDVMDPSCGFPLASCTACTSCGSIDFLGPHVLMTSHGFDDTQTREYSARRMCEIVWFSLFWKLFCFQWGNVNRCWCPCFCSLFCVSMVFERLFDVSSQSAILISRSACHLAGRKVSFENVWPANCLYQDITICVHGISLLMLKSQSAIAARLVILSG